MRMHVLHKTRETMASTRIQTSKQPPKSVENDPVWQAAVTLTHGRGVVVDISFVCTVSIRTWHAETRLGIHPHLACESTHACKTACRATTCLPALAPAAVATAPRGGKGVLNFEACELERRACANCCAYVAVRLLLGM